MKATKSHKWKVKHNIPLLNKKVKLKIERKPVVFGHTYLKIDSSENNNKAICLTCKEKISWGGSKPTKFNTSNLHLHSMTHKDKYKCFVDDEKKREN